MPDSNDIALEAVLQERVSKNTGKPYKVVCLYLAPGVEKLVFLTSAEIALLEQVYQ